MRVNAGYLFIESPEYKSKLSTEKTKVFGPVTIKSITFPLSCRIANINF